MTNPLVHTLIAAFLAMTLLVKRRRLLAAIIALSGGAWLYLCSTPAFVDALNHGLTRGMNHERSGFRADAIVVLGGGGVELDRSGPTDQWRRANDIRAARAASIYKGNDKLAIYVSGADDAPLIAQSLEKLGVPADAIRTETESTTTRTNALFTRLPLVADQIHTIALVTSTAHMRRASGAFTVVGFDVIQIPASSPPTPCHTRHPWVPHVRLIREADRYLHEYVGLAAYQFMGWA